MASYKALDRSLPNSAPHYLFSSSRLSAALALAPAPPHHTRLVSDNGEGEDSGSGAGKEGDGEVKGEGDEPGGSSLRTGLPKGWIQGDWIHSRISQEDLDDLAEGGLIPYDSARLPGRNPSRNPGRVSAFFLPPTSTVDFPFLLTLSFEDF